ncbi:MAG: MarC family protein [Candidatus Thermoplasmatota archaeon]|jgi:multiple antibiotic resistance protein|nr:MarC family protein [Candidatus Thermoplasmatota archaeon]MCL5799994.1 MarC family protein [Candidatus Thermoplasmatota archaeon]
MFEIVLFFVTVFVAIFSILNPIGAVPILVSLTEGYTREERVRVIKKSLMVAAGMLFGFMLLGIYIFEGLSIDISDFQIAGGILVFKVAFDMMQGKTSNTKFTATEEEESLQKDSIGVVPLGTPLLAGPGSITTSIIYFNLKSVTLYERFAVISAILAVLVVSFVILVYSVRIFEKIGRTGSLLLSRIMGLLIAAIGVSFIVEGITTLVQTIA